MADKTAFFQAATYSLVWGWEVMSKRLKRVCCGGCVGRVYGGVWLSTGHCKNQAGDPPLSGIRLLQVVQVLHQLVVVHPEVEVQAHLTPPSTTTTTTTS